MNALIILIGKVFVNSKFLMISVWWSKLINFGMLQTFPLKQNLVPRFEKGRKDYLGFEEIGKLRPDVIFAFRGSFLFCVVAPLNFDKLDASGSGSSESFFQNTDGYFRIGQVIVDLYGPVIDILEHFRLLRDFEALAK